jgi:hypothetical protein
MIDREFDYVIVAEGVVEDRRAMVDGVRACRHLVSQSPLQT